MNAVARQIKPYSTSSPQVQHLTSMSDTSQPTQEMQMEIRESKIEVLENQYISLLESRIANLEQRLAELDQIHNPTRESKSTLSDSDHGSDVALNDTASIEALHNEAARKSETAGTQTAEHNVSRYEVIVSKYSPDIGDFKDIDATETEEAKKKSSLAKSNKAFTLRKRTIGRVRQEEVLSSDISIHFEPLQKLVGRLTMQWGWSEAVTSCSSPYAPLIWSWSEAHTESEKILDSESADERQARVDLGELLKLLKQTSGSLQLDRYLKERDSFLREKTITHAALWTLFPPGTVVISRPFLGEIQVFTVSSSDLFVGDERDFTVTCFGFDWDGVEFGRVPFEFEIPHWGSDQRSIVELPIYPLTYHSNTLTHNGGPINDPIAALKSELISRGKKFVKYCKAEKGEKMFKYKGNALLHSGRSLLHQGDSSQNSSNVDESSSGMDDRGSRISEGPRQVNKKWMDGTAMVDFESFFEYLPTTTPILGGLRRSDEPLGTLSPERRANPIFQQMYKFQWDKHPPGKEMTDDQYLHCPPRVLGYALKQKQWVQLLVKGLVEPDKADERVFREKLQLEERYKTLIEGSVRAHERGKETKNGKVLALQDFAPDKGKGLVIMLYGYPGVGKTLTAESVALMVGKPLLSVGVSDIGIVGDKVEANLQKVFDLAEKWEAILLFDEADVFLEARGGNGNDLRRNAMVSVLLRVLEYYDGILILTTNRMRSFDIAVQSRIHIAVKYEELSLEEQLAIFESFLDQLDAKKLVHEVDDCMRYVKQNIKNFRFNGRQIRNVVSTAMGHGLVDDDGGRKLHRKHLKMVAEQTLNFKGDLRVEEKLFRQSQ